MDSQHPDSRMSQTLGRAGSVSQPSVARRLPLNPPAERTTLHRNDKPPLQVSTVYSTIAARALSSQKQVVAGITPLQLT